MPKTKPPLSLNWPGVVALGLVLAAITLLELFGPPGTVLRIVELVLAGVGIGGAALPTLLRRDGGAGLALLFVASAIAVASSSCSSAGGAAAAAVTARDLTCRGGRVVCRVLDRVCRTTGGEAVLEDDDDGASSDGDDVAGGEASAGDAADELQSEPRPLLEIVEDHDGRRRFLASAVGLTPNGEPRVLGAPGDLSDAEEARVIAEWRRRWRERAR